MEATLRQLATTTNDGRYVTVLTPFTDAQAARRLLNVPATDFVNSLIRRLRLAKFNRETGMVTEGAPDSLLFWAHKIAVENDPELKSAQPAQETTAHEVGMSLEDMFVVAKGNKLKFPKMTFVIEGRTLQFGLAGERSRYAGAVMVTDGEPFGQNQWFGHIRDGVFVRSRQCDADMANLVLTIARDPKGYADEYGRLTGNCCFCRRKLTTSESTVAGYGPVCAEKYGLDWGNVVRS